MQENGSLQNEETPLGLEAHFGMEKGSFRNAAFLCTCAVVTTVETGVQCTNSKANKNYRKTVQDRSN